MAQVTQSQTLLNFFSSQAIWYRYKYTWYKPDKNLTSYFSDSVSMSLVDRLWQCCISCVSFCSKFICLSGTGKCDFAFCDSSSSLGRKSWLAVSLQMCVTFCPLQPGNQRGWLYAYSTCIVAGNLHQISDWYMHPFIAPQSFIHSLKQATSSSSEWSGSQGSGKDPY